VERWCDMDEKSAPDEPSKEELKRIRKAEKQYDKELRQQAKEVADANRRQIKEVTEAEQKYRREKGINTNASGYFHMDKSMPNTRGGARGGGGAGMMPDTDITASKKLPNMAKGGMISSASKRADGCVTKGKTKGKMI
jgi:hypothetical protein